MKGGKELNLYNFGKHCFDWISYGYRQCISTMYFWNYMYASVEQMNKLFVDNGGPNSCG